MRVLYFVSAIAVGAQVCSPLLSCQACTANGCVWGSTSGCGNGCTATESCVGAFGQCPLAPPAAVYATAVATPYAAAAPIYSATVTAVPYATAPVATYASFVAPAAPYVAAAAPYSTLPYVAPAASTAAYYAAPAATYAAPAATYATYVPQVNPVYASVNVVTPYTPVVPPMVPADAAQNLYVSNSNGATNSHAGTPNPVVMNPARASASSVDCSKGRFVLGDDNYDTYCANYVPYATTAASVYATTAASVPYVTTAASVPYVSTASVPFVTTSVPYATTTTTTPFFPAAGNVLYTSG